ncbi:MAG: response regulator [Desulfosalsimonas sp.]
MIQKKNPGLVLLLDQNLPDLQGSDLIACLEKQDLKIPFVVMTGHGDESLAVEMMKLGADDYLLKDFNLTDLLPGVLERLFRKLHTEERLQAAEKALRESEKKYRELVECSNSIILQMDQNGRLLYFNNYAEKFFGFSRDELLGKNAAGTIVPYKDSQDRDLKAMLRDIHLYPDQYAANENENMLKDGSRVWISWSNQVLTNDSGQVEILCIGHDITAKKQAEMALVQAKKQAEAASRAKSEFLANMSHEIRTPLNGIMGMMQLLQKTTELDADQKHMVDLTLSSAGRLTRLLSDILDLSRVEAGKITIHEENFSTREIADSVVDLFKVSTGDKDVILEYTMDPDLPETVTGDPARIRQILFNLVGNALKYTEQGKVSLNMMRVPPGKDENIRILFTISDTGIGIPEDKLETLFQPFVQVDGTYTRKYQGAGLGLAIVRRLVELMGGNISIESTYGKGTAAYVVLPFKLTEKKSQPEDQQAAQKCRTGQGLRILMAEDDISNQYPLQRLLTKMGHEVTIAENGQQVIDLLDKKDFDCVLMDIQMPVMDGVEAAKEIRRLEAEGSVLKEKNNHSRIPIIALTAYAMDGDREKFLEAGMDDYLAKPVQISDLERLLKKYTKSFID